MSGRFDKAPLVYVVATIRTTDIPDLIGSQYAALHQAMIRQGLPEAVTSEVREINFSFASSADDQSATTKVRRAFFNAARTESFVVEPGAVELRVSVYTKYEVLIQRFTTLLDAMIESVDVFGKILGQELLLSYADVIVPYQGRSLADYFDNDGRILPLDAFGGKAGQEIRLGQVQISRLPDPHQKIDMVLEQLPIQDGKFGRALPAGMIEPDVKFNMPLNIKGPDDLTGVNQYVLLMTQATKLRTETLEALDIRLEFESLHKLTSDTFWTLINTDVCKTDWEYVE